VETRQVTDDYTVRYGQAVGVAVQVCLPDCAGVHEGARLLVQLDKEIELGPELIGSIGRLRRSRRSEGAWAISSALRN
jgi:hypothetical protein